jgi:hypothetical protein
VESLNYPTVMSSVETGNGHGDNTPPEARIAVKKQLFS